MEKVCDSKSVGVIIRNDTGDILLIERKKFPYGFAPPAGHVDDFPSPEDCARGEVSEEVGLTVESLRLLWEGEKDNPCRRKHGTHHYWWIYEARATGMLKGSKDETRQVGWFNCSAIQELLERTKEYQDGNISEDAWEELPGIEPAWSTLFDEIGITKNKN